MGETIKKFTNPAQLVYEIEDVDGNNHVLKAKRLTTADFSRLSGLNELINKDIGLAIVKQMVIIFGGKEADYEKFDCRIIRAVLDHFNDQQRNPIK